MEIQLDLTGQPTVPTVKTFTIDQAKEYAQKIADGLFSECTVDYQPIFGERILAQIEVVFDTMIDGEMEREFELIFFVHEQK